MKILIFPASHRKGSLNRKLAVLAAQYVERFGAIAEFVEYTSFDMPLYNDDKPIPAKAHALAKRMKSADGMIVCTPEYNWSYPGTLKNIIDWTSRLPGAPLAGKTALLMSATPGKRGGIMGLQHLKLPLEALEMFVFPKMLPLGNADILLSGKAIDDAKQQQLFISLLKDYITFTKKLSAT